MKAGFQSLFEIARPLVRLCGLNLNVLGASGGPPCEIKGPNCNL